MFAWISLFLIYFECVLIALGIFRTKNLLKFDGNQQLFIEKVFKRKFFLKTFFLTRFFIPIIIVLKYLHFYKDNDNNGTHTQRNVVQKKTSLKLCYVIEKLKSTFWCWAKISKIQWNYVVLVFAIIYHSHPVKEKLDSNL